MSREEEASSSSSDPTFVEETMFMYFPDRLPSQRQLHYQLCDIMDDQLQEIIHSNDGKEKECTVINEGAFLAWNSYYITLLSHHSAQIMA